MGIAMAVLVSVQPASPAHHLSGGKEQSYSHSVFVKEEQCACQQC